MSDFHTQGHAGLIVEGATVYYGQHQALNQVSITVKPGEVVVILGANGAGKSTLLQFIAGLINRSSGAASMDGHPLTSLRPHQIVESGIALVPEGRGIFGDLSVEENLLLGAYAKRARSSQQEKLERVYSLFPRLVERRRQLARTMSGGEQQMVAIGRAMMSNPSILMLDEPSLGLSPLLASDVFKTIKQVREIGLGILLVEQNAKQSLAIADRGYLIETGQIVAENAASALMEDSAVQKAYLGGAAGDQAKSVSFQTPQVAESAPLWQPDQRAEGDQIAQQCKFHRIPEPYQLDRVSVRQVTGQSVADLIRSAEARQRAHWQCGLANEQSAEALASTLTSSESVLADMLQRMEDSASKAVQYGVRSDQPLSHQAKAEPVLSETSSNADSTQSASRLEIYRKPAIEIYRRETNKNGESSFTLIRKHRI